MIKAVRTIILILILTVAVLAQSNTTHGSGSGSPEGRISGSPGSTYARTDGNGGFYVKTSGNGVTGWSEIAPGISKPDSMSFSLGSDGRLVGRPAALGRDSILIWARTDGVQIGGGNDKIDITGTSWSLQLDNIPMIGSRRINHIESLYGVGIGTAAAANNTHKNTLLVAANKGETQVQLQASPSQSPSSKIFRSTLNDGSTESVAITREGYATTYNRLSTAGTGLIPVSSVVSLSGKTTDIEQTPLPVNAGIAPSGLYKAMVYAMCTTPGGGTLTVNLAWTDSAGATTAEALTLPLNANGRAFATVPIFTSGASHISYSTTIAGLTGAPQYALKISLSQEACGDDFSHAGNCLNSVILADGDSILWSAGGSSDLSNRILAKTLAQMSGNYDGVTIALGGQTTTQIINNAAATADRPYSNNNRRFRVLAVLSGVNDFVSGRTKEQVLADILTYAQARIAAGWQVIVFTQPSNSFVTEANRQFVNNGIKSNASQIGYTVADWGSDANMGCNGCHANRTYFLDGSHPTIAGNDIGAGYLKAALNSLGLQ